MIKRENAKKKKNMKRKNVRKEEWEEKQFRHIDEHIDRKERKRKIITIPFENEIFPLTINNRSLPERII